MEKIIIQCLKKIKEVERKLYSSQQRCKLKVTGKNFNVRKKFLIKNGHYISIGDNFLAMDGCRVEAWDRYENEKFSPQIVIGDNVSMNADCHIGAINKIIIGNNVLMGSRVFITDHSHGDGSLIETDIAPNKRALYSKGTVIIEDNVWIGEGAVILPGVKIGRGCTIGANAVVTKSMPENCVVGGCPAKVVRKK